MKEIFKNDKHKIITFKAVFGSEDGKKVLATIAKMCGNEQSTFDSDPIMLAYRAARRDTYLEIQQLVDFEIKESKNKAEDSDQRQSQVDEEEDPLN